MPSRRRRSRDAAATSRPEPAGAIVYGAQGDIIRPGYRQIKVTGLIDVPAEAEIPRQDEVLVVSGRLRIQGFKLDRDRDMTWYVELGGKVIHLDYDREQEELGAITITPEDPEGDS